MDRTNERAESGDSAAFYKGDEYDEYDEHDDFGLVKNNNAGGGGGNKSQKMARRQDNRGGGGGVGTIYSAKHVRAKEALQKSPKRN